MTMAEQIEYLKHPYKFYAVYRHTAGSTGLPMRAVKRFYEDYDWYVNTESGEFCWWDKYTSPVCPDIADPGIDLTGTISTSMDGMAYLAKAYTEEVLKPLRFMLLGKIHTAHVKMQQQGVPPDRLYLKRLFARLLPDYVMGNHVLPSDDLSCLMSKDEYGRFVAIDPEVP